jgi:WD40 repeat protein
MQPDNQRTPYIHNNEQERPRDTPQIIRFCPTHQTVFAVGSWDQTLRLYEIYDNNKIRQIKSVSLPGYPIAMDFIAEGTHLFLASSDKAVYSLDANTLTPTKVGSFPSNFLFLRYVAATKVFVVVTENLALEFYSPSDWSKPLYRAQFNKEITALEVSGNVMLLASTNGQCCFVDLRSVNLYTQNDFEFVDSQIKTSITHAAINSDAKIFSLGSCDGRVFIGIFDVTGGNSYGASQSKVKYAIVNPKNSDKNFIFVAHSKKMQDQQQTVVAYPITGMAFNSRSKNFLYTTGSDGSITFWDIQERNRIRIFNLPTSVASSALSPNGFYFVFGLGYDWSQGVWGTKDINYSPTIGLRPVWDDELVYRKNAGQDIETNVPLNAFGTNHLII